MLNKKSLSPLIATILLIVVSVILVIIVLTWGKNVSLTSLNTTDTIFTEADSYLYMFSFQKLQNNNLIFKNISSSNKDIIIVGYKINSFYDHKLLNKINYLQEPTTLSPGSLANIKIVVPPEESFSVEFYTDDNKYITLSNIRETNPVHNFSAVFGGDFTNALEQNNSIIQTSDGGYLLLGHTRSYGAGSDDIWLIKTDSQGNTCDYSSNGNCTGTGTFAKTFGGASYESPTQILESSDGGYFIFGRNNEIYGEFDDGNLYMIKINSVGEIILEKTIGGKMADYFDSFYQTTDGGAIVGGLTASYGGVHEDWSCNFKILILKIDKNGNINIDNLPESTFIGEEFYCEY